MFGYRGNTELGEEGGRVYLDRGVRVGGAGREGAVITVRVEGRGCGGGGELRPIES